MAPPTDEPNDLEIARRNAPPDDDDDESDDDDDDDGVPEIPGTTI